MRNNMLQFTVLFAALLSVVVNLLPEFVCFPYVLLTYITSYSLANSIMTALFSTDDHEWFLLKKKVCINYVYLAACGLKMSWNCTEI